MELFGVGGVGNWISVAGNDHRDGVHLENNRQV
jgi:hypothetical protein